jgi:hypothetical protein
LSLSSPREQILSFPLSEEGVKRACGQNAAWTHTLCGLKAHVQFGTISAPGSTRSLRM